MAYPQNQQLLTLIVFWKITMSKSDMSKRSSISDGCGKTDLPRPVDRDKYSCGYKRAFGLCANKTCGHRYHCKRWLETPEFNYGNVFPFEPDKDGKCEFFVKDK